MGKSGEEEKLSFSYKEKLKIKTYMKNAHKFVLC